jgi:hypothetical protein
LLQFGASNFKVFKVDQDLYDLAKILRAQLFNERFADLLGQKLVKRLVDNFSLVIDEGKRLSQYLLECLVDHIRMLEVIVGEEIKLV